MITANLMTMKCTMVGSVFLINFFIAPKMAAHKNIGAKACFLQTATTIGGPKILEPLGTCPLWGVDDLKKYDPPQMCYHTRFGCAIGQTVRE